MVEEWLYEIVESSAQSSATGHVSILLGKLYGIHNRRSSGDILVVTGKPGGFRIAFSRTKMSVSHQMPGELQSSANLQESQNRAGKARVLIRNSLLAFTNQRAWKALIIDLLLHNILSGYLFLDRYRMIGVLFYSVLFAWGERWSD